MQIRILCILNGQQRIDDIQLSWLPDGFYYRNDRTSSTALKFREESAKLKTKTDLRVRALKCPSQHASEERDNNKKSTFFRAARGNGRNLSGLYNFMTMLSGRRVRESIYAIARRISPPATLIYLCAAFIFWQFVSFDFGARALLEYSY